MAENIGLSISGSINGGGIKHFTNWDAGLTSIEFDQKEKFIEKQSTEFLTDYTFYDQLGEELKIKFGADSVKIVDNFAAVSYPEYTDLAKSSFYFNDSHVYNFSGIDNNALQYGFVYIPIFRFKELANILDKELDDSGADITILKNIDLTGSYIILHYHDDSLYAGPVEKQILQYVKQPNSFGNMPVGTFTIHKIYPENSMSSGFANDYEYILIANIGTNYKPIANSAYVPTCCGSQPPIEPTGSTGPTGPTSCLDAYIESPEATVTTITITADTDVPYDLMDITINDDIPGVDTQWEVTEAIAGISPLYNIVNINLPAGSYPTAATVKVWNPCQTGATQILTLAIESNYATLPPNNPNIEMSPANIIFENAPINFGSYPGGSIPCDIEFIKYKPIIGCGKVDVYYINKGVITDYTNQIATCTNHHLKSGDIIRIFGALDTSNGTYYVDPINENTFYIYTKYDSGFQNKLFINTTDDVQFIKIGNVLDSNETTWQLYSSLTSPRGRNGYGATFETGDLLEPPNSSYDYYDLRVIEKTCLILKDKFNEHKRFWCDTILKLPDCLNNAENFNEIFAKDYGINNEEFDILKTCPIDRIGTATLSTPKITAFERFPVLTTGYNGEYYSSNIWTGAECTQYLKINSYLSCDGIAKVRSVYGIYDIWNTAYNLVNNFNFGCSIDFKKDTLNNKYLLLVGEKGFNTLFSISAPDEEYINNNTANIYYQLPQYGHGAAYLFEIKDVHSVTEENDPTIKAVSDRISLLDYYTAYRNDNDIDVPEPLISGIHDALIEGNDDPAKRKYIFNSMWSNHSFGSVVRSYDNCRYPVVPFPDSTNSPGYISMRGSRLPIGHALFLGDYVVVSQQDLLNNSWGKIETYPGHEYWYGSMVYALADINNGTTIYTNNKLSLNPNEYIETTPCKDIYFSNLSTLTIPDSSFSNSYINSLFAEQNFYDPYLSFRRNSFDVYPYVDNFGKSVALDIIGEDVYVFASSRTKPIINRPKLGDPCISDELSASYVGYIHVFKNGVKTQKIYETDAITFPSQKWQCSYYKANKFAICMYAQDGKLYWGQAKGIELLETDQTWANEKSKIFVYENQNDIYTKTQTIENYNDRHNSYLINIDTVPDHKEYHLRNLLDDFSNNTTTEFTFYPSDRFGSYFQINKTLLVANAFDNQNELGVLHNSENSILAQQYKEYNQTLDYLHVYILLNNQWQYVQKIAPAFNKNNSPYEYDSILFPAVNKSIRNLGNITYNNNVENSRSWDIDLTNSFTVADNRIILKDPVSYSIFEQDFSIVKNNTGFLNLPTIQNLIVNPQAYFTYDEQFKVEIIPSIEDCKELVFTNLNGLYAFDYEPTDYKTILYRNSIVNNNQYLNITTPVYFITLPKVNFEFANVNSVKFIIEEIIAEPELSNGIILSSLKLVVFTKDPRTTIYPSYLSYNNLCNIDTINNKVYSKYIENTVPTFYRGGAFDSYLYTENSFANNTNTYDSCNNYLCLAKTFSPTITTGNGLQKIHQFEITKEMLDISSLLIDGDMLLSSGDNRAFSETNGFSDILEFNDVEKFGYDSSINVENTLIIGFIFDFVGSHTYEVNTNTNNLESGIRINTIEASLRYNFSSNPEFIENNGASLRTYKCILNKVANFNYITANSICFSDSYNDISSDNSILFYRKPVIAIGSENIGLHQTRSTVYDGATTKSLEIISVDNFNNYNDSMSYLYTRHFSIQPLEYLSIFMQGESRYPYKTTTLHVNGPLLSTEDLSLVVKAIEPINSTSILYLQGPMPSSEDISLHMHGHRILTSPYLDYPHLFISCTYVDNNNIPLDIKGFQPTSLPLYIKGPIPNTSSIGLFSKSFYFNDNLTLSIDGVGFTTGNTTLFLQNQISTSNLNLNISGPIAFNSGINSSINWCEITNRDELFDISNDAEEQITGTNKNSISLNKYSNKAEYIAYASKDITNITLPNNENADDDFYLNYRDNKSIASNNDYLCIATNVDQTLAANISYWSGKHTPSIQIFNLNNEVQAELVYTYENLFADLIYVSPNSTRTSILSGSVYLDASINCLDISIDNNIAASFNITVKNITTNAIKGYISCILILSKDENVWNCTHIISQETASGQLIDILTGIHLQWVNQDLYYTINNIEKLDDSIKIARFSENIYTSENIDINFKETNLYTSNYIINKDSDYLRNIHYGFGHKFVIDNDVMFVAAPLVDPYWSNNIALSSVSNSYTGVVFIFELINDTWTYTSTVYNDGYTTLNNATNRSGSFIQRLFGYDLDYSSVSNSLVVSQPFTHNIYRFNVANISMPTLINTFYKNEVGYGNTIAACNSQVVSLSKINNGVLYYGPDNSTEFTFDTSLTDNEISQYQDASISNYSEQIINFKAVHINNNEYILAIRKFYILYNNNSIEMIQKVSLLNLKHVVNGTLFIKVPVPSHKELNTFIKGPIPYNKTLNIHTKGKNIPNNSFTLYIGDIVKVITPFFLKAQDPILYNNYNTLFIYSSVLPSSIFTNNSFNLFMNGRTFSKNFVTNYSLYIQSPSKLDLNNNAPLWIGTILRNKENNFNLFTYGTSSPSIAIDQVINNKTTLFIKSNGYGKNNFAPLFINTSAGGEKLSLFIDNSYANNTFSLFVDTVYKNNNNLSLLLLSKDATLGINTFIRGYRS